MGRERESMRERERERPLRDELKEKHAFMGRHRSRESLRSQGKCPQDNRDPDVRVTFDSLLQNVGAAVNSLAWSSCGDALLASADDDSVLSYSLSSATSEWTPRLSLSRKFGAAQVRLVANTEQISISVSRFVEVKKVGAPLVDILNKFRSPSTKPQPNTPTDLPANSQTDPHTHTQPDSQTKPQGRLGTKDRKEESDGKNEMKSEIGKSERIGGRVETSEYRVPQSFDDLLESQSARLWDMRENRFLRSYTFPASVLRGNGLQIHPREKVFAVSLLDQSVMLFSTEESKPLHFFINDDYRSLGCHPPSPPSLSPSELSPSKELPSHDRGKETGTSNEAWHRRFVPLSAFDEFSSLFVICTDPQRLRLLDLRALGERELAIINLGCYMRDSEFVRSIQILGVPSANEAEGARAHPPICQILITTNRASMFTVSAWDGRIRTDFQPASFASPSHSSQEAEALPDASPLSRKLPLTEAAVLPGIAGSSVTGDAVKSSGLNGGRGGGTGDKGMKFPKVCLASAPAARRRKRGSGLANISSMDFHLCGFGLPASSPDGKLLAMGLWDEGRGCGRVAVWSIASGRHLTSFGNFRDVPYFAAFHPTRAQILVGDVSLTSWRYHPRH